MHDRSVSVNPLIEQAKVVGPDVFAVHGFLEHAHNLILGHVSERGARERRFNDVQHVLAPQTQGRIGLSADDTGVSLADIITRIVNIGQAELAEVLIAGKLVFDLSHFEKIVLQKQAVLLIQSILIDKRCGPKQFFLPLERLDLACPTVLLGVRLQKIAHVHVVDDVAVPDEVVAEIVIGECCKIIETHD